MVAWTPIYQAEQSGEIEFEADLSPRILRRYDYFLKLELTPTTSEAGGEGPGLSALEVKNTIQHHQRALPILAPGTNTITVRAEPAIATRTVEGRLSRETAEAKNEVYVNFNPSEENVRGEGSAVWLANEAEPGWLAFPVEVPGDIVAVRFGGQLRARDPKGKVALQVSFDDGNTWRTAWENDEPLADKSQYVKVTDPPPGARKAVVRYHFSGPGGVGVMMFRIDVDYLDPHAGWRPLKVTYHWQEGGQEKTHTQVVSEVPTSYKIEDVGATGDLELESLVLELAE